MQSVPVASLTHEQQQQLALLNLFPVQSIGNVLPPEFASFGLEIDQQHDCCHDSGNEAHDHHHHHHHHEDSYDCRLMPDEVLNVEAMHAMNANECAVTQQLQLQSTTDCADVTSAESMTAWATSCSSSQDADAGFLSDNYQFLFDDVNDVSAWDQDQAQWPLE
jgi:hypothetical protein